MPAPRKPSRPAGRATARRTTTTTRRAARRPAPRRRPAGEAPPEPFGAIVASGADDDDDQAESRPVAVARSGAVDAGEAEAPPTLPGWGEEPPGEPPPEAAVPSREVDQPRTELLVGLLALVVGVSCFLRWYGTGGPGLPSFTGWSSGTWGPVVALLSFAAVAIVVLRRLGVALSFPLDHALVLEGIGWVNTILLFLKRFFPVKVGGFALPYSKTSFFPTFAIPMVLSILLALVAGRLSRNAPMVAIPGWFRAAGGKLAAALLGGALIVGALVGFVIAPVETRPSAADQGQTPTQVTGAPKCLAQYGFPVPKDVKATNGFEPQRGTSLPSCTVFFSSKLSLKRLTTAFTGALEVARWRYKLDPASPLGRSIDLRAPKCGRVTVTAGGAEQNTRTAIAVIFERCPTTSPTPR